MPPDLDAVMIDSGYFNNSLWSPDPLSDSLDLDTVSYTSPFDSPSYDDNNSLESPSLEGLNSFSSGFDLMSSFHAPLDFSSDFQLANLVDEIICEDGDFSSFLDENSSLKNYDETSEEIEIECIKHNVSKSDESAKSFKDAVDSLMEKKFWSKRSSSEQTLTLNALSYLFSHHLTIKDQMDIVHIIYPNVVFRPDHKEFTVAPSDINDLKLWKIKEYLKKNMTKFSNCLSNSLSSHPQKTVSSRKTSLKSKKEKRSNLNYSRTKRKPKAKSKKIAEPIDNLKFKQTEKEIKSGFFVYEKILKLCSSPSTEEDEDVNVLE